MHILKWALFVLLLPVACNTVDKSKLSGWKDLQESGELVCEQIKKPEPILKIQDVKIVSQDQLYVDVLDRRGASIAILAEYSPSLSFDLNNNMPFALGLRPIGSGFRKDDFVVVAMNDSNEYTDFTFTGKGLQKNSHGTVKQPVKKAYLTNTANYFVGIEDNKDELGYFLLSNKKAVPKIILPSDEVRVVHHKGQDYLVSIDDKKVIVKSAQNPKNQRAIAFVDAVSHVEAVVWGDKLVLAAVYGDPLSDVQTQLSVSALSLEQGFKDDWSSVKDLSDISIGNLKLYPCDKGMCLLMNQWIDSQTTIAKYAISEAGSIQEARLFGKMEKPQFINDAYYNTKQQKSYFVLREKSKNFWNFSLCRL